MMEIAFLRAWPRNPATGAPVIVRVAGGGHDQPFLSAGDHYRAGLVNRPRRAAALGIDAGGWTGASTPTVAPVAIAPQDAAHRDFLLSLHWPGAAIEIDAGPDDGALSRLLTGEVAEATFADGLLVLSIADLSRRFDRPVLGAPFKGSGGAEGYAGCAGRARRRSWGLCRNVEGRLFDAANNIWEFGDPARPLQAYLALRDKGRPGTVTQVAWAGSVAATLTALAAATPPQGGGVVAPSIACAKWWTEPSGPLTADVQGEIGNGGYTDTVPGIADRLIRAAGGAGLANLPQAEGWRGDPGGLHVDDGAEAWSGALDRLTLGVSLLWGVDAMGAVSLRRWSFDDPVAAIEARFEGREATLPPTKSRAVHYRANHRPHADAEISAAIDQTVERIVSDDWLTRAEKSALVRDVTALTETGETLIDKADDLNAASGARDAARDSIDNLMIYLTGLAPAWDDTSADTPIVPATLTALYDDTVARVAALQAAIQGMPGADGAAGFSVGTVKIFRRAPATSVPALPSVNATLTLADGSIAGLNNGWTPTPQGHDGNPLWVGAAAFSGTGATVTIAPAAWVEPVIESVDGAKSAPVFIYTRTATATAPDLPTTTATFSFADGSVAGLNNGWAADLTASGGPYRWRAQAAALSTEATDTIAPTAWTAPKLLAQDGNDGEDGASAKALYLNASRTAVVVDSSGAPAPATQDIVLSVGRQNTTATVVWELFDAGGGNGHDVATHLSGSGDTRTLSAASARAIIEWGRSHGPQASPDANSMRVVATVYDPTPVVAQVGIVLVPSGGAGTPGITVANARIFRRAPASPVPALPSVTATYNFGDGSIDGLNNGWGRTPQAHDGNPLWTSLAVASGPGASDTIAPNEWAEQVIESIDGAKSAPVFAYLRTATATPPDPPTTTATFTFPTGSLTGLNNGWTGVFPTAGGPYLWTIQAAALSTEATDTIAPTAWTAPNLLVKDGAPGSDGDAGVDALSLTALPPHVAVRCNAIGAVEPGQLPRAVTLTALDGDANVTAGTTWTIAGVSDCAVSATGGGGFEVTTLAADQGWFEVEGALGAKAARARVTIAKTRDGAAGQRSYTSNLGTPTGAWAPANDTLSLNIAPGSTVTLSMTADYAINTAGSGRIEVRLMYRNLTDGGAWTQVGPTFVGSNTTNTGGSEPELTPGSVSGSATAPAPSTMAKVYEFRVEWVRYATSALSTFNTAMQVTIT